MAFFADVFYHGIRCGLLHEAKMIYGEIHATTKYLLRWDSGKGQHGRLIVNQNKLLREIEIIFERYILELRRKGHDRDFERTFINYFSNI